MSKVIELFKIVKEYSGLISLGILFLRFCLSFWHFLYDRRSHRKTLAQQFVTIADEKIKALTKAISICENKEFAGFQREKVYEEERVRFEAENLKLKLDETEIVLLKAFLKRKLPLFRSFEAKIRRYNKSVDEVLDMVANMHKRILEDLRRRKIPDEDTNIAVDIIIKLLRGDLERFICYQTPARDEYIRIKNKYNLGPGAIRKEMKDEWENILCKIEAIKKEAEKLKEELFSQRVKIAKKYVISAVTSLEMCKDAHRRN